MEFKKFTIIACSRKDIPDIPSNVIVYLYPENELFDEDYKRYLFKIIENQNKSKDKIVIVTATPLTAIIINTLIDGYRIKEKGFDIRHLIDDKHLINPNDVACYSFYKGKFVDIVISEEDFWCIDVAYLDLVCDRLDTITEEIYKIRRKQRLPLGISCINDKIHRRINI